MTTASQQSPAICQECGSVLEHCAVCDSEGCPDPLCYRCLRIAVGQEIPQPHVHGG